MSFENGELECKESDMNLDDLSRYIRERIGNGAKTHRKMRKKEKKIRRLQKKMKKKKNLSGRDKKKIKKYKKKVRKLKSRKQRMEYSFQLNSQRMQDQMELMFYKFLLDYSGTRKKTELPKLDVIDVPWKEVK